jgi:NitT/TauT family transport system ATP-binding protein
VTVQAPMVEIHDLCKEFHSHDGGTTLALDRVSLQVETGQFVSVVGPSGCGKSTLLAILAGVMERSDGTVMLRGADVSGPRRDVGVMFQEALLLPYRTVMQNIMLPAIIHRLPLAEYSERAKGLLKLVQLDGFGERYPSELSGGMQQRAAIARGLLHDPAILLMDEPFGALDAMTREQMNLDLLDIWSAARKTVVLITHSIAEAVFLSDRVIVMSPRPGRIVDTLDIDLPRPRNLTMMATPAFGAYAARIRASLGLRGNAE